MMNTLRLALIPLVFFLATTWLRAAQYDRIVINELPFVESRTELTAHGYVEYRFRVANSDSRPHRVMIIFPSDSFGGRSQSSISRITDSVDVPAHATAQLRILQPPVGLGGYGNAEVVIDGRYQKESLSFQRADNHMSGYSRHSHETGNILVSQRIPAEYRDLFKDGILPEKSEEEKKKEEEKAAKRTSSYGGSPTRTDPELFPWLATVTVSEWSDHWLAYTRFDCVLISSVDWRDMQEQHSGSLAALRSYCEAGGMLAILGTDWTPPKEWVQDPVAKNQYFAVFGQVFVLEKDPGKLKQQIASFRETVLTKQVRPWKNAMGYSGSGRFGGGASGSVLCDPESLLTKLPVVDHYGVPIKLILALIIIFAVLIGPVNIYALSKMNRRIWLLWTVPLTSLVAAIMVFGISFVQEGFLSQSGSMTMTILDQRQSEATTVGYLGYYSTLTPSGILFSPQTEATASLSRGYRSDSRSLEVNMLAGGNQLFSRGWIHARVPAFFAIRKSESQRKERLNFDWDANTVTNGLGVKIDKLTVCSPKGEFFEASNVEPGQKTAMTNIAVPDNKPSESDMWKRVRADYETNLTSCTGRPMSDHLGDYHLSPGKYVAEFDSWNPFVEVGIDRMKPYKNRTTILGLFE